MPKPRPAADRSELECFVLGLLWQRGPSSPYELRTHMAQSPSTQWSGSAGAIYPLVVRLQKQGLLSSRATRTGRRVRREYRITPAGLRALRRWIGPPLADSAITVTYDPLRSRARFLGVLTPAQRLAWVESARRALDEVEARILLWDQEFAADPITACITASGRLDTSGRRRWLDEVRLAAAAIP